MPVPGHKTEEKVYITRKWQRIRTQTRNDGAFEAEAHVSKKIKKIKINTLLQKQCRGFVCLKESHDQ